MSKSNATSDSDRENDGFGKYYTRFKTILRRSSPAQPSTASLADLTRPGDPSVTRTRRYGTRIKHVLRKILKRPSGLSAIPSTIRDVPVPVAAEPPHEGSTILFPSDVRAHDQYHRVKAMFIKHNMTFDESTWPIRHSTAARVEKPIRMRVRLICHFCRTNYSSSRVCTSCHHPRCEKCTRLPLKNRRKGRERAPEMGARDRGGESAHSPGVGRVHARESPVDCGASSADDAEDEAETRRSTSNIGSRRPKRRKESPLAVSSQRGGNNILRNESSQRVHRSCCKCRCTFLRDSKECLQCRHFCCTRCPRLSPKLDNWPNEYPVGVISQEPESTPRQWKKPRVRVRWTCHQCRKLFMEGEYRCANCSHARCSNCQRDPPKRLRQQVSGPAATPAQEADESSAQQSQVGASSAAPPSSSKHEPELAQESTMAE
jgi:hypothetical protein